MLSTENVYGAFTDYLQRLGLGTRNYYNPAENYQIGQFAPLENMFNLQSRMATAQPMWKPSTGNLGEWAMNVAGGSQGKNMYSQAGDVLRGLFGFSPAQRAQVESVYEPVYNEGQLASRGNVGELQQLLQTALRPTLGNVGSKWLAGQLPTEQQRWIGRQALGGQDTFLDYLREKYNLQGLGF